MAEERIWVKKKHKPPAFQFYVKDWLSSKSVLAMSPAQCGYYINLLAHAWDNDPPGTLPNDPDLLWRLARAESRGKFEQESGPVLTHFPPTRTGLSRRNYKLVWQFGGMKTRLRQKSDAAKQRWEKEKSKSASTSASIQQYSASASASASAKHNPPNPPEGGKVVLKFQLPDWVPKDAWDGFIEMRKSIHKPLKTERAIQLAVKKLETLKAAGDDPGEVLNQSTMNGWPGLFEIRKQRSQVPAGNWMDNLDLEAK